jgi:hypothetical protein
MKLKNMKYLAIVVLCMFLGCGESPVTPDPPPEFTCPDGYMVDRTTDPPTCVKVDLGPSCGDLKGNHCSQTGACPEGYSALDVTFDCDPCCLEDPPESDADPKDYITLDKAARIINKVQVDSRSDLYISIWAGVRDERDVAKRCPAEAQQVLHMSSADLYAFADEGEKQYNQWHNKWHDRLLTENKRADEFPEFKGISDVRKSAWQPFEDAIRAHRTQTNLHRKLGLEDPLAAHCRGHYDSISGWRSCRKGTLPMD